MTWDHVRGLEYLVQSNSLWIEKWGVSITWDARSLLAFGDQHISEFYSDFGLIIIDHPHVSDAVHAKAVISFKDFATPSQLELFAATSVGASHDSYLYKDKHWALVVDTAAQVSVFCPNKANHSPVFWHEVFELVRLVPDFFATSNPIDIAEVLSGIEGYAYGVCMYGYRNYSLKSFCKNVVVYDDLPSFDGRATGSQLGGGQPGNLVAWKDDVLNAASRNFLRNALRTLENAWVSPRVLGWSNVQFRSPLSIDKCLVKKKVTKKMSKRSHLCTKNMLKSK